MKILMDIDEETYEEFDRIVDQIIRDVVELRGMPLEKGGSMRTSVEGIERNHLHAEIVVSVHKVECSRLDDF